MSDHSDLIERIAGYLATGGLFNPELANHDAVRDLLIESRDALSSQSLSLSEAREEIERFKKLSDHYGVALMMIRAGCSDPARFAGNILDDRQPINVELDEEDFDENHR